MINSLVRPADFGDHQRLSNLLFFETRLHRHLDWRSPLDWLGAPFYWALEDGRQVAAALACPPEAAGIAWVRLFVYAGSWTAENAWGALWSTACEEISRAGGAQVAAIAMQPWFQRVLAASGFESRQQIVMLEWQYQPQPVRGADGIRIRRMSEADLPEVEGIDAASFPPLWQNRLESLRKAFSQSMFATVAEGERGILGYQLTTGARSHAHLARLAVHPSIQGRGAGRSLLSDLFTRLTQVGILRLSVNTQNDNAVSLALYQKMGFVRTGEGYPVYTFDVPSHG